MTKFLIAILITCFILLLGFIYLSLPSTTHYSDSQKEKKVSSLLGRKANLTDEKTGSATYKDAYLTFEYPANAVIYKYKDPSFASRAGTLAAFSYDLSNPKIVFNYTASKRDNIKNLSDDPSYQLRKNPERGYKMITKKIGEISIEEFTKDSSLESERSVFIMKDGAEYIFTILGSDKENLDKLVAELLKSLRFIK